MQLPPFGLTAWILVDKLIPDLEPGHRSVYSAETGDSSLASDESEQAISRQDRLGAVYG